ncbi:MAG: YigZ family protein, partial [Burkholderiales bacterium]|nr:YigZ family protein [Burkholderiales bacterium]
MSHTLTGPVRHEAEIRKSRFLALAAPIDSPEAAQAFLDASRDLQATHNCWAWRCGA